MIDCNCKCHRDAPPYWKWRNDKKVILFANYHRVLEERDKNNNIIFPFNDKIQRCSKCKSKIGKRGKIK
mgnify:CR=1 FL=1